MCRHLAYLGPPVPVGDLLTRGPHSLRTQSWAPRDMRGGGTINADGFGLAWWTRTPPRHAEGDIWPGGTHRDPPVMDTVSPAPQPDSASSADNAFSAQLPHPGARAEVLPPGGDAGVHARPVPLDPLTAGRYRNAAPIWTDPAVDEVLPQIHSTAVLAAIRSATVGMPVERTACAPFTHGRWAFSHNGVVPDWRNTLTAIAEKFDSPSLLEAESMTDSAALWVILRGLLDGTGSEAAESRRSSGAAADSVRAQAHTAGSADHRRSVADRARGLAPEVALPLVIRAVAALSPGARLNLLVGDGETVWATTWWHALSVLVGDEFVVVASEPYDDDPRWQAIADRQLVVARPGWLSVQDLDIEIGRAGS